MKKSKLSLALVAGLMSIGALAGCDNEVKSSRDGFLLIVNGDKEHPLSISADEILGDYYNDSTKYQAIYDTIYSIIVKNYFEEVEETINYHGETKVLGKSEKAELLKKAQQKVDDDIDKAKSTADANNTKWKKEMETVCSNAGVEVDKNYESLKLHYLYDLEKERFENNFYTYHIEEIKNGDESEQKITYTDAEGEKQLWNGYFEQEVPYHVSHILIKLEKQDSNSGYVDGKISKKDAGRLADVVEELGAPEITDPEKPQYYSSFESVAFDNSDDGSKDLYGDLGIMDYSTTFVNEFQLGVYAYENFYYTSGTARSKNSVIDLVSEDDAEINSIRGGYKSAIDTSFYNPASHIPTIDKSVFVELKNVMGDETATEGSRPVLDGDESAFPRNILFNKYLNRHEAAFITGDEGDALSSTTKKTVGYWKYTGTSALAALTKPVLSTKVDGEWTPILCVRATGGSGNPYEGIHFIVINRSAFEKGGSESVHKVSQTDYYTTFYPEQSNYPTVDGKPSKKSEDKLKTYVNFSTDDTQKTKNRAEEFASKLKSFDSEKLQKFIFRKYMNAGQIKIADAKLNNALAKWIDSSIEKKVEDASNSWVKTWNEYIDKLNKQNSERKNLIPQVCRIGFKEAFESKTFNEVINDLDLTAEQKDALRNEMKRDLIELGKAADDSAANTILNSTVVDEFKTERGLCNNGKAYN